MRPLASLITSSVYLFSASSRPRVIASDLRSCNECARCVPSVCTAQRPSGRGSTATCGLRAITSSVSRSAPFQGSGRLSQPHRPCPPPGNLQSPAPCSTLECKQRGRRWASRALSRQSFRIWLQVSKSVVSLGVDATTSTPVARKMQAMTVIGYWRPQPDSNRCRRRERAVS